LKQLSLSQCGLSSASVIDLAKAVALNQALETLSLRGNPVNEDAAAAIGALLASGSQSLKHLNLSSCRLEDSSGMHIGDGLATNTALEALHLRDNLLREGTGRVLSESLRKHTTLTNLSLELNSIDFRFLHRIKQLLERNNRYKENARPKHFRKRIEDLKECEQEVKVLSNTLKRNHLRKRKVKMKQAAMMQELKDSQKAEALKQQALQVELERVQELRQGVGKEIEEVMMELRGVRNEGDHDVNNLRAEIGGVEDKIKNLTKHMEKTQHQLEVFDEKARDELAALGEELGKKEKERDIASASSEAAHRHLDNFAASMKSIEPDLAGGADPRQRLLEQEQAQRQPGQAAPKATNKAAPKPKPSMPASTAADSAPASSSIAKAAAKASTAPVSKARPAR